MATEVICDREHCMWNEDGECSKSQITIDSDRECLDYER